MRNTPPSKQDVHEGPLWPSYRLAWSVCREVCLLLVAVCAFYSLSASIYPNPFTFAPIRVTLTGISLKTPLSDVTILLCARGNMLMLFCSTPVSLTRRSLLSLQHRHSPSASPRTTLATIRRMLHEKAAAGLCPMDSSLLFARCPERTKLS